MNKKEKFTYDELIKDIKQKLEINTIREIEINIKSILRHMREDGYIREKGSYYLINNF